MAGARNNFRYFNRDGAWLDFGWSGLELDALGRLQLISLPRVRPAVELPPRPSPGCAGIAIAHDGSVFSSNPAGGRVFGSVCGGDLAALPLAQHLSRPSGVAVSPVHQALFVSDAETGVVHGFDWTDWHERIRWYGFREPVALAAAMQGDVYVCDRAAGRVEHLTAEGERSWFGDRVSRALEAPQAVALSKDAVCVLDAHRILLFDTEGELLEVVAEDLAEPCGLAISAAGVLVGDASSGAILVFKRLGSGWSHVGRVEGFSGPVAALATSTSGSFVIHTGDPTRPLAMGAEGGYLREGLLWSKALDAGNRTVAWRRLEAIGDVPDGTRLELSYQLGDSVEGPPLPLDTEAPFPAPWITPGPNLRDVHLGDQPAKFLWIGARYFGDGSSTPRLEQVRADFDQRGYLERLPANFEQDGAAEVLTRLLALIEGEFAGVERRFEVLAQRLAPSAIEAAELAWLASFFALELGAELPEAQRREMLASAHADAARRGTARALLQAIERESGVKAALVEPIQQSDIWSLAAEAGCPPQPVVGGLLGLDTVLAGSEPQGAVLGQTAALDRSHLLFEDEYGTPLFDDVAHRFSVYVHAGDAGSAQTLERVRHAIEQHKPAHTLAELCIVTPQMRIGYQASLGIDTVVAAPPAPSRLGDRELFLSGPAPGRLGGDARVGSSTRL